MPVYEYRCRRCKRRTAKLFKTLAAVETPTCAHCGSRRLDRLYSRVSVRRGGSGGVDDGSDDVAGFDSDLMSGLESGDPRSLARMARQASDEMGEEIPGEFEGVLRRMEAGEMPGEREIEALDDGHDESAVSHDED